MDRALLLAVVLLLAGCSEGDQAGSDSTTSTTSSPTPGDPSGTRPQPPSDVLAPQLHLTDCTGVGIRFVWPLDSAPSGPEVPSGWETSEMAATDHHVQLNVCQRISVGGFERGPVHVLLEMHDKFAAPQTCLELGGQDYNDVRLLRTIWVDDPAVADYLSTELGMPAIAGDFVFTRTPAGDADVLTWDWGVPGEDRSTVAYTRVDTVPGGSASLTRLFWHDGEDLFRMDYHDDEERPAVSTPASVGVLKAPMMHAAPEVGAYAGIYSLVDAGDYEGTIHSYEDFGCEQPSS